MIATIDCRNLEDYKKGHIQNSTHISLDSLEQSWYEFPIKGSQFDLCCYQQDAKQLLDSFQKQNYLINKVISHEQIQAGEYPLEKGSASQRLWKGNPLLENHLQLITENLNFEKEKPLVLDIGCGSGRDSILMAQSGLAVLAIDNKPYALEKVAAFAEKLQVKVEGKTLDCQKNPQALIELIKSKQPQLIMQSRYLHRPLLELYQKHLPSGAIVAIHTFLEGAAKFGSPKNPAYLLNNNELAEKFSEWNILLDAVHFIEDGRPLSLFLAKKP